MADRIIQTDTLQGIANALRGGESQSDADKIEVTDFAEVAEYLKDVNDSFVGFLNKNATSITIPKGATALVENMFKNFTNLAEVNLPSSLTSIGASAFYGCTSLESIIIPEGVTSIAVYTFSTCTNLAEVNLPSSLTSIGTNAFDSCSSLESITIPEGVTSILRSAFYNCANLAEVNLPSSLTSIGRDAFKYCTNLAEVNLPSTITEIGTNAFGEINVNAVINCGFSEGTVSGAPWGAPNTVTINYDVNFNS